MDLVHRIDTFLEDVRLDDDEADHVLRDAGVDPEAVMQRLRKQMADVEEELRSEFFAKVDDSRRAALVSIGASRTRRSHKELIARLAEIRSMLPPGQQPQAFFSKFEEATDEDLESLVADFEALLAGGR